MDIPSWCRVGQKVVCEPLYGSDKDGPGTVKNGRSRGGVYPERGGIYTIRKVVFNSYTGTPSILLVEVVNDPRRFGLQLEPAFGLQHFRPLVSQQDDIETHFAHFLTSGKDARISEGV